MLGALGQCLVGLLGNPGLVGGQPHSCAIETNGWCSRNFVLETKDKWQTLLPS